MTSTMVQLQSSLQKLNDKGYKAYKSIKGCYQNGYDLLFIDHVQGDPFAKPSTLRYRIAQVEHGIPHRLFSNRVRRIGLQDYLARRVRTMIHAAAIKPKGSGKSGTLSIDAGSQIIVERTAILINEAWLEVRLEVGLPADGRRILGHFAAELLCMHLPELCHRALHYKHMDAQQVEEHVNCMENQEHIRSQLRDRSLVAFIANGCNLPRLSGDSEKPLTPADAVPFMTPESLSVEFTLLHPILWLGENRRSLVGMGIPEGITLLVGGGFHGKSTLLEAIQAAVYPHIPGDGREYAVTRPDAVKIRAESGRQVSNVNISAFINNLPYQADTSRFSSTKASGSTSQAAGLMEALQVESRAILIDEDTSATNFLIRDARMQELISNEFEPITPLIDCIQQLRDEIGVSLILIMGGSGDYLDIADRVIQMRSYKPYDITKATRQVCQKLPQKRTTKSHCDIKLASARKPSFATLAQKSRIKLDVRGTRELSFNHNPIDLSVIEQIYEESQGQTIGRYILALLHATEDNTDLLTTLKIFEEKVNQYGLEFLGQYEQEHPGRLAMVRRYELAAVLNRLRDARFD